MIMILLFTGVLVLLTITLLSYSKEGDIGNFNSNVPNIYKLKRLYPSKKELLKRFHDLILYKGGIVKWNRYIIIALVMAFCIIYYYRKTVTTKHIAEIMFLTGALFLAIDLPNRWLTTHVQQPLVQEATLIYSLLAD